MGFLATNRVEQDCLYYRFLIHSILNDVDNLSEAQEQVVDVLRILACSKEDLTVAPFPFIPRTTFGSSEVIAEAHIRNGPYETAKVLILNGHTGEAFVQIEKALSVLKTTNYNMAKILLERTLSLVKKSKNIAVVAKCLRQAIGKIDDEDIRSLATEALHTLEDDSYIEPHASFKSELQKLMQRHTSRESEMTGFVRLAIVELVKSGRVEKAIGLFNQGQVRHLIGKDKTQSVSVIVTGLINSDPERALSFLSELHDDLEELHFLQLQCLALKSVCENSTNGTLKQDLDNASKRLRIMKEYSD